MAGLLQVSRGEARNLLAPMMKQSFTCLSYFHGGEGATFGLPKQKKNEVVLPMNAEVVVEVPKGSVLKRLPDGSLDFLLPCPCPFNYGSVHSIPAPDGYPLDAIILGDRLPYGHRGSWKVKGMLKFIDAGVVDNKLVCVQPTARHKACLTNPYETLPFEKFGVPTIEATEQSPPILDLEKEDLSFLDQWSLSCIFSAYAVFKGGINASRGKHGLTSFLGWDSFH